MSVQRMVADDQAKRDMFGTAPRCYRCNEPVGIYAVVWQGHARMEGGDDGLIVLHPDCATKLACELIGDARNARRVVDGKPVDAGCPMGVRLSDVVAADVDRRKDLHGS